LVEAKHGISGCDNLIIRRCVGVATGNTADLMHVGSRGYINLKCCGKKPSGLSLFLVCSTSFISAEFCVFSVVLSALSEISLKESGLRGKNNDW
jgi:hypothetical protein